MAANEEKYAMIAQVYRLSDKIEMDSVAIKDLTWQQMRDLWEQLTRLFGGEYIALSESLEQENARLQADNSTMRALLEEAARDGGDRPGVEDLRERTMFCFYCGGWVDYQQWHGDSPPPYAHHETCWWLKARAYLAEHPKE